MPWPSEVRREITGQRGTYGGNNIPDRYLDRFNAATDAWKRKIDGKPPREPDSVGIPDNIADFLKEL